MPNSETRDREADTHPRSAASLSGSADEPAVNAQDIERLLALLRASRDLLVLTGAGCSTDSGIPDYRDAHGEWKHARPVQLGDFLRSAATRRRYWARSMLGWRRFAEAAPNPAHRALARLETAGRIAQLITQNVDGLHQRAGSRRVIDLHGRLDRVQCMDCGRRRAREDLQTELERLNPGWSARPSRPAPDGDACPADADHGGFRVPACRRCGGLLKPTVVFFGETVPRARVERALEHLERADMLLIVGSSLMVFSGYRFVRRAAQRGIPIGAINIGRTRADAEITLKLAAPCGELLPRVAARLG